MAKKKKEVVATGNECGEYKYQTIASCDHYYSEFDIMKEYNTLEEARKNYANDMDEWKKEHNGNIHYGIRKINKTN